MQYFALTKNGEFIGILLNQENISELVSVGISVHELDGTVPNVNEFKFNPETETWDKISTIYTRLEFLERFNLNERAAIRASENPIVKDIMELINVVQHVDLTHAKTIQSVHYLASVGLVPMERVPIILGQTG